MENAVALLEALGGDGRRYYFERQLILDTLYPGLLALTLSNLFLVIGRGVNVTGLVRMGVIASWLAAGFDYVENLFIAAMLKQWPEIPGAVVKAASVATLSKSVLTSLAVAGLLALGLWRLRRNRKMRTTSGVQ